MATTPISPLRQRMLHDMMMRGLSPRTQHQYVRNVQRFAAFLERPPDTATAEDLRNIKLSFPKMLSPLARDRIVAPLDAWTANEVLDYCRTRGIELPQQYADGLADSLECWNCTVRTDLPRFLWMQKRYPELAARLATMMREVYGAALTDYETHIKPVIDAADTRTTP